MLDILFKIDSALFYAINSGAKNPVFDRLMPVFSWDYLWIPIALLLLVLLVRGSARTRWIIGLLFLVFLLGDAMNARVMKPYFDRPRPYTRLDGVHKEGKWLSKHQGPPEYTRHTYSMPSNHSANAAALAAVFLYFFPRFWPWLLTLVMIVGFSRVYIGVHYPFDVLVGFWTGMTFAGLILFFQEILLWLIPDRFPWLAREADGRWITLGHGQPGRPYQSPDERPETGLDEVDCRLDPRPVCGPIPALFHFLWVDRAFDLAIFSTEGPDFRQIPLESDRASGTGVL